MDILDRPPITAWSFSRLTEFETCPYRTYLRMVVRSPILEIVEDPSHPLVRGRIIHEAAESYVKGELDELPRFLQKFEEDFKDLREKYAKGKVRAEEEWGYADDWGTIGYFDENVQLRVKLDVLVHVDDNTALAIDYKTGKNFGSEVRHTQQGQLYVIAAFMRYPELSLIEVQFWFLDHGTRTSKMYTREKAMKLLSRWQTRADKLLGCIKFDPKPNKMNCRFCEFGPQGTDACAYGVPYE